MFRGSMSDSPHTVQHDAVVAASTTRHVPTDHLVLVALVGRDLNSFRKRDQLLDYMLTQCQVIFRCRASSVFLYDESGDDLVLEASLGDPPRTARGLRQKLGQGVAGWAAENRQSLLVTDVRTDERFQGAPVRDNGFHSFLCVPMLHFGRLVGVISLTQKENAEVFDAEELHLLEALASHFASAIIATEMFHEIRRFNDRLSDEVKQKTAQLQHTADRLRTLQAFSDNVVESIASGVVVLDRKRTVRHANGAARRMLNLPDDEHPEMNLARFGDRAEVIDRALQEVLDGGPGRTLSKVAFRGRGEPRLFDVEITPFRESDISSLSATITFTDVTDRVAITRRMEQAEKLAVIGKLAAKVAHEVNNPLDAVKRYVGLAGRRAGEDDQVMEFLGKARDGLDRVGRIVQDLLQMSRSSVATVEFDNLHQLLEQVLEDYAHRIEGQSIEVVRSYDGHVPDFAVGPYFEVFGNLVKNALDAMPRGGRLELVTQVHDRAVVVQVIDTGCGMTDDVVAKIFDPFFTTKPTGQGTGLGMVICRDVVEKQGGKIEVSSAPEQGTTFRVEMPLEEQKTKRLKD